MHPKIAHPTCRTSSKSGDLCKSPKMELRWQVCRKQGPDLEDFGSSPDLPDVLQVGQGRSMSDVSPFGRKGPRGSGTRAQSYFHLSFFCDLNLTRCAALVKAGIMLMASFAIHCHPHDLRFFQFHHFKLYRQASFGFSLHIYCKHLVQCWCHPKFTCWRRWGGASTASTTSATERPRARPCWCPRRRLGGRRSG